MELSWPVMYSAFLLHIYRTGGMTSKHPTRGDLQGSEVTGPEVRGGQVVLVSGEHMYVKGRHAKNQLRSPIRFPGLRPADSMYRADTNWVLVNKILMMELKLGFTPNPTRELEWTGCLLVR